MLPFIAGILTFLLVVNCLLLILIILMQLPKKDAGAGMAFGGAAADALFGAGSGNFLTQTTRYATITLFALALGLGYMEDHLHAQSNGSEFEKAVQQKQSQTPIATPPPLAPVNLQVPTSTNNLTMPPLTSPSSTPVASSNAPAAPAKSK